MKKINKIVLLVGLGAMMCASNYTFANGGLGAVIQNPGVDGEGPGKWPDPRFSDADNADGDPCEDARYDNLTGLTWSEDNNSVEDWNSARSLFIDLELCGYSDWRLPTVVELLSIINFSNPDQNPAAWLNTKGFNVVPGNTWTVSPYNGFTMTPLKDKAWAVNLVSGGTTGIKKDDATVHALAVRGHRKSKV